MKVRIVLRKKSKTYIDTTLEHDEISFVTRHWYKPVQEIIQNELPLLQKRDAIIRTFDLDGKAFEILMEKVGEHNDR